MKHNSKLVIKYIILIIIALGYISSLIVGLEYNCTGDEMFPTFDASPFVFRQNSLGSSMQFYYSISGLLLNVLIWIVFLFVLDYFITKISNSKTFKKMYKTIVVIALVLSIFIIIINIFMIGKGFDKNLNYWYWNIDKEAVIWGVQCEPNLIIMGKSVN